MNPHPSVKSSLEKVVLRQKQGWIETDKQGQAPECLLTEKSASEHENRKDSAKKSVVMTTKRWDDDGFDLWSVGGGPG